MFKRVQVSLCEILYIFPLKEDSDFDAFVVFLDE